MTALAQLRSTQVWLANDVIHYAVELNTHDVEEAVQWAKGFAAARPAMHFLEAQVLATNRHIVVIFERGTR